MDDDDEEEEDEKGENDLESSDGESESEDASDDSDSDSEDETDNVKKGKTNSKNVSQLKTKGSKSNLTKPDCGAKKLTKKGNISSGTTPKAVVVESDDDSESDDANDEQDDTSISNMKDNKGDINKVDDNNETLRAKLIELSKEDYAAPVVNEKLERRYDSDEQMDDLENAVKGKYKKKTEEVKMGDLDLDDDGKVVCFCLAFLFVCFLKGGGGGWGGCYLIVYYFLLIVSSCLFLWERGCLHNNIFFKK